MPPAPRPRLAGALIAAVLAAAGPAGAATVAFDTFGPQDAYDDAAAGLVGPGPTGIVELGFVFTAPVSAAIGALTVPLSVQAPPAALTFTLYGWDGSAPAERIDLAAARVGSDAPQVLVVDGWEAVLAQGAAYAILASAPSSSRWWAALGDPAVEAIYRLDGAPGVATGWVPAARLELDTPGAEPPAPVPAPGALPLVVAALASLRLAARRRSASTGRPAAR